LKLIGAPDRRIVGLIVQQALAMGVRVALRIDPASALKG
jgi:hypothetical protein